MSDKTEPPETHNPAAWTDKPEVVECNTCSMELYIGKEEALKCACGVIHCAEHWAECNVVTHRPDLGKKIFEARSV